MGPGSQRHAARNGQVRADSQPASLARATADARRDGRLATDQESPPCPVSQGAARQETGVSCVW